MSERGLVVDRPLAGVLRLRLDRPARRNAVDGTLLALLREQLEDVTEPVVVLGSTAARAFCAGGDLSLPPRDLAAVSAGLFALYERLLLLPAVVVAAVDGHAIGAGAQLLLASDLRVGGPRAAISFAGARSGLAIGTWGLPGLVGRGRAMDLALTGRAVGAEEARTIGLLDRLEEDAPAAAVELAGTLAAAPPDVLARAKRLVRDGDRLLDALAAERDANADSSHRAAGSRRGARA